MWKLSGEPSFISASAWWDTMLYLCLKPQYGLQTLNTTGSTGRCTYSRPHSTWYDILQAFCCKFISFDFSGSITKSNWDATYISYFGPKYPAPMRWKWLHTTWWWFPLCALSYVQNNSHIESVLRVEYVNIPHINELLGDHFAVGSVLSDEFHSNRSLYFVYSRLGGCVFGDRQSAQLLLQTPRYKFSCFVLIWFLALNDAYNAFELFSSDTVRLYLFKLVYHIWFQWIFTLTMGKYYFLFIVTSLFKCYLHAML